MLSSYYCQYIEKNSDGKGLPSLAVTLVVTL